MARLRVEGGDKRMREREKKIEKCKAEGERRGEREKEGRGEERDIYIISITD